MIRIIYNSIKKDISSSTILYIYDFGSYKGFLKDNTFTIYKILHKEMKDSSFYEECEIIENIPFKALNIESYNYIEENNVIYTNLFSITFLPIEQASQQLESSQIDVERQTSSEAPLQQSESLFDQSLLKQIHSNSRNSSSITKKVSGVKPELNVSPQSLIHQIVKKPQQMIPLEQVLKGRIPSLYQSPKGLMVKQFQH